MFVLMKVKEGVGYQYQERLFIAKWAGSGENHFETTNIRDAVIYRSLANAVELAAKLPGTRVFHVTFTPTSKEECDNAVHSTEKT